MIKFLIENNNLCLTITSICTVIVSILAFGVSSYVAISQNRFNKNSVRPIGDINCLDYSNCIKVELINNGLGVMIIKNIHYKSTSGKIETSITNIIPDDIRLSHFIRETSGRTLIPGNKLVLLEFRSENFIEIDKLRSILSKYTVIINFTDIYNKKFIKERNLFDLYATNYKRKSKIILK